VFVGAVSISTIALKSSLCCWASTISTSWFGLKQIWMNIRLEVFKTRDRVCCLLDQTFVENDVWKIRPQASLHHTSSRNTYIDGHSSQDASVISPAYDIMHEPLGNVKISKSW
jgi:hypothetical protein